MHQSPDAGHPVKVVVGEPLGNDTDAAVAHGLYGRTGQGLHVHEPLLAHQRLDHGVAPLTVAKRHLVVLHAFHEALRLKVPGNGLAGGETVHAGVGARFLVQGGVEVHGIDEGQGVALPHLEVDGVVAGSDLQRARAEIHLHSLVADDGQRAADDGQDRCPADEPVVARVMGVHGNSRVRHHRLRTRRGDHEVAAVSLYRVAEVVELAGLHAVIHLQVGEGRGAARAPVDDALASVDQSLVV